MTAAAGVLSGLAKLKRQDSSRPRPRPSAQEGAPRKRKRHTDVVVVRGRLRLYSTSGFFLLLGLVVLAMGVGMATLGYWPHTEGTVLLKMAATGGGSEGKMQAATGSSKTEDTGTNMASSGGITGAKMAATEGNAEVVAIDSSNVQGNSTSLPVGGALVRFLEQHRHSEKMRLMGPFTMGIGIFIFICANAILHENRDRETKVIHMRDMYSTVIDIQRLREREQKQLRLNGSCCSPAAREPLTPDNPSAARLAADTLLALSSRAGGSCVGGGESCVGHGAVTEEEEEEGLLGEAGLQEAHTRLDCGLRGLLVRPGCGSFYSWERGCQQGSMERKRERGGGGGHRARSIVTSSISAFTLPVIKLNNCVIDQPDMEAITEEGQRGEGAGALGHRAKSLQPLGSMESFNVPLAMVTKASSKPPGLQRSNSASSSHSASSLSPAPSSGCWLSPGAARSHFGSNSSLHMLSSHSKSLDLERGPSMLSVHPKQCKHPSWPRLDRSNSSGGSRGNTKGYVRLEDREEQGGEPLVTVRRDYSKRELLLMISRSHNNLSFEHNEFNNATLKRGSSESRF